MIARYIRIADSLGQSMVNNLDEGMIQNVRFHASIALGKNEARQYALGRFNDIFDPIGHPLRSSSVKYDCVIDRDGPNMSQVGMAPPRWGTLNAY